MPPQQVQVQRDEDYRLSVNDLLDFRIFQEPDFDAVIRVSGDGTAIFPMIGQVHIAGKTIGETTELLRNRYIVRLPYQSSGESYSSDLRAQDVHHFGTGSKAGNLSD